VVGRAFFRRGDAVLIPQPYAFVQALTACRNCKAPHPLARNYWRTAFADDTKCPQCGEPVDTPEPPTEVPVALTGVWGLIFNLCVGLAKLLAESGRRLKGK
jgi:hypothetical protein